MFLSKLQLFLSLIVINVFSVIEKYISKIYIINYKYASLPWKEKSFLNVLNHIEN